MAGRCVSAPLEIIGEDSYAAVRRKSPRQFEAYDEFAHRYDMPNGCQTVLLDDQGAFVGLAALRSRADGPTSADDRDAFASVAPYVLSATRLQRSLEGQGGVIMAGALDQVKATAIICDGRGRVCGLTAGAEDWLGRTSRMVLRDARLLCARPFENRRLNEAIKKGLMADTQQGVMDRF